MIRPRHVWTLTNVPRKEMVVIKTLIAPTVMAVMNASAEKIFSETGKLAYRVAVPMPFVLHMRTRSVFHSQPSIACVLMASIGIALLALMLTNVNTALAMKKRLVQIVLEVSNALVIAVIQGTKHHVLN